MPYQGSIVSSRSWRSRFYLEKFEIVPICRESAHFRRSWSLSVYLEKFEIDLYSGVARVRGLGALGSFRSLERPYRDSTVSSRSWRSRFI
jgi:hypothetical protein